jgi:hypothetical protein
MIEVSINPQLAKQLLKFVKSLTFFNENPNYQKIFNIIDSTISEFNNIFVYMLNTSNIFYGQVSTRILTMGTRVTSMNKFYDVLSSSVYTLPLQNNLGIMSGSLYYDSATCIVYYLP